MGDPVGEGGLDLGLDPCKLVLQAERYITTSGSGSGLGSCGLII